MRGRILLAAAAALAVAAAPAPGAADDATAGRGKELAAQQCAACHGEQGRSAMPDTPSLAGQPAEFITLQMILFREGLRDAPPMPDIARGMSDADIEAVAAHYASLPPGPPEDRDDAARDAARMERGRQLSVQLNCGVCHLPDYAGRAQMPRLAAQREEYLARALTEYRDNRRVGTDTQMNAVVYGLPDADIAALAHYLAYQD